MKRSNPFESLRQLQTINQHEKIRKIVSSDLEFKRYDQNREPENLNYIAVTTQNSIKSENLPIILIRLNAGESISLCGTCHVSILVGGVNILGAELQGSGDEFGFLPIYSPCTNSLISITGIASGKSHVQPLIHATIEEKAEITRLLADWAVENQPSIIAIKTCNNGLGDVENMMPVLRNCFANTEKNELIQGISVVSSPVKPKSDRENLFPHFNLPISDVETLENVLRKSNSRDSCHQSVICLVGRKNTGKSSVARYLSNRIVSKYRKLCYMECDVGQPEFTPAGIISLHIIDRPLLGPPFTHQMIPFHGIFFGATSPKDEPDAYLGGLIELIKIYRNELSDLPLVVNTCGWVKGVGLELLDSFLSTLLPTDIIHMTNGGTSYIHDMIQQKNIDAIELRGVSEVELNKLKLNAADSRALGVISYFSQSAPDIWDFLTPISAKPPYFVSFGAVRIKFLFDEVPFSQAMIALNGTIVGLAIDHTKYYHTKSKEKSFGFIPTHTPSNHNCVGLGLIRAIDLELQCFYILTPVPSSTLEKVNLVLRGSLECPVGLLIQGFDRSQVPYTSFMNAEGVGSVTLKNRHLGRKGRIN